MADAVKRDRQPGPPATARRDGALLAVLIAAQAAVYLAVAVLSFRFEYHSPGADRPILPVLGLLAVCFGLHLLSLAVALRLHNRAAVAMVVLSAAVAFRALLLPTWPIQEIDIYRYLWDGASLAEGVNPYRYSPLQVRTAEAEADLPEDLQRLVALRDGSEPLGEVLRRVHFGELTTIYPPVAQAVYAAATLCTPDSWSVFRRVVFLKGLLAVFDLGTLVLVIGLLSMTGRHPAWSLVYGWSPLVLKEFANSGHLDTIAVFLATAALACWLRGMRCRAASVRWGWLLPAGLLLGLAIGAKLYPVVLLPLIALVTVRRAGPRAAALCIGACVFSGGVGLAPMLLSKPAAGTWQEPDRAGAPGPPADFAAVGDAPPEAHPPRTGLGEFLVRWEINDLPFMLVVENLRPDPIRTDPPQAAGGPWFVIVPDAWRQALSDRLSGWLKMDSRRATFIAARSITLLIFLGVSLGTAWKASGLPREEAWLGAAFLTVAWFWALSPTMNPWYWTWALPLLPFVRRRAWFAVSGLLLLYYLRFWLRYHHAETPLAGTAYRGGEFFHFVVVPLQHGLWMGWLCWEWARSRHVYPPSQTEPPRPGNMKKAIGKSRHHSN